MRGILGIACVSLSLAGCGGGNGGPGATPDMTAPFRCAATHVDGTLTNAQGSFTLATVAASGWKTMPFSGGNTYIEGQITDGTSACGQPSDHAGTTFAFQVAATPRVNTPKDNFFFALLQHETAPAMGDELSYATDGNITIRATSPHLVGSFDLTFPDGYLAGCFDLSSCPP